MIRYLLFLLFTLSTLLFPAYGMESLDVQYPYRLSPSEKAEVHPGSTQMLYVSLEEANVPEDRAVSVTLSLPEGYRALPGKGWEVSEEGRKAVMDWTLPADFGQLFEAIPVISDSFVPPSGDAVDVTVEGDGIHLSKSLPIEVGEPVAEKAGKKIRHESWYIQGTALPVDENGEADGKEEKDTIVVPDVTLENMKTRLTGGKSADWTSLLSRPVTYMLLDLRNPMGDEKVVHGKAVLVDRGSGEEKPGLISVSTGGEISTDEKGTDIQFSLSGSKMQTAVFPLYADPFTMNEGDYNLRITLSDGGSNRITEIPLTVVKKRSTGLAALGLAIVCLIIVLLSLGKLKRSIVRIGARGDIAIALFGAMAFGGVVVPVTLFGDFLHVFLGPFSGLVTGLLSGVVQYLLLMALLVLFRKPGVAALFYLIRWLLSAILFGRVTPVGILLCALSMVVIEGVLWAAGFYRKKEITRNYGIFISFLIGVCDAGITFVNMEQLMLFYRMYYADWFIGLYMVINGLLYSSLGSFLGWKTGRRLKQVMGS